MSVVRREFLILFVGGMVGVALIFPYVFALTPPPEGLLLPSLVLVALVQNAVIVAIAVAAGLWFARRVGLAAPLVEAALRGEAFAARLRATLPLAIVLGVAAAVVVLLVEVLVFQPQLPAALRVVGSAPPLWSGFLASFYGGITEELLTRLFLVSLFAWLFSKIVRGPVVFWAAIAAGAVLFGLGHLPATAALVPLTPVVVARAIVLNGIPGVAFGWPNWRRGLESAMVAHFSADLLLHVVTPAALS